MPTHASTKHFLSTPVGSLAHSKGRTYRLTHDLAIDAMLGSDLETGESKLLSIETITPVVAEKTASTRVRKASQDVENYSDPEWDDAGRRLAIIQPILERSRPPRAWVAQIAAQHHVGLSTIYKWLNAYQDAGHLSALVNEKRGRKSGSRFLPQEKENIINLGIEKFYLTTQRHTGKRVIEEVQRACRLAGIPAPSPNTIWSRIRRIHPAIRLRRRGFDSQARNRYEPNVGSISGADRPLALVQIDHTQADIILVDEINRRPIGRPWLTVAIDVYSRMVIGLYVTYEHPSACSVGLCLSHAMCPKTDYLTEIGVTGEWPVWGRMAVVHSDNGKEFRGNMIKRACEEYSIDLQWRPVLVPEYGAHIERLMGTFATEIHAIPGTTKANPKARAEYDSEGKAILTLREFEQHLVEFIVNNYHLRMHLGINQTPLAKWKAGIMGDDQQPGSGRPEIPQDPTRIRIDFMPFVRRTIQPYGILLDNISYYDPILDPYINATDPKNRQLKRQFVIRRDPRNISIVYFLDPASNHYAPIRYRNIGYPDISIWELRQATEALRKDGRSSVDEAAIFAAVERNRTRIDAAYTRTKAARRRAQQRPTAPAMSPAVAPPPAAPSGSQGAVANRGTTKEINRTPGTTSLPDIFSTPILPYDEVLADR